MVKALNFTNAATYKDGVDWVRTNVVLRNMVSAPVLQLDVRFPNAAVTVYMQPTNHYILAFQGTNGIYLLDDPSHSEQFEKSLKLDKKKTNTTILRNFKSSHTHGGLETFAGTGPNRYRTFRSSDLFTVHQISEYAGGDYFSLRKPLSLLVCMLAEAARFPIIQNDFVQMYRFVGYEVRADEIVQCYRKGKVLRVMASKVFPGDRVSDAVYKMNNRATELGGLLGRFKKLSQNFNPESLIPPLLNNQRQAWEDPASADTRRFREICKQLFLSSADDVTELISLCKDPTVVRAAQETAALPSIDG